MRFLLLLLCLAVGTSEGRRGYAALAHPTTFSVSKKNRHRVVLTSAPATAGHHKVMAEIATDRLEPQKRRNILPRFLKIPLSFSFLVGKSAVRGFFAGYLAGAVYGLWGLVQDALAGENGIREAHDRSFNWGKNYAKFCAVSNAIVYGMWIFIMASGGSKLMDEKAATGEIDYRTYQIFQHNKDAINRKLGITD